MFQLPRKIPNDWRLYECEEIRKFQKDVLGFLNLPRANQNVNENFEKYARKFKKKNQIYNFR